MAESTDNASLQREIEALRKRLRLFEKVAEAVCRSKRDLKTIMTPISEIPLVFEKELNDLFAGLSEGDSGKADSSRKICAEYIQLLRECSPRLRSRIREVTDLADVALATPRISPCLVSDFIAEVLDREVSPQRLRDIATSKGIRVDIAGLTDLPPLNAHASLLSIVLAHVIEQTISAMQEGGSITVRAETDSRERSIRLNFTFRELVYVPFQRYGDEWWVIAVHVAEAHGGSATMSRQPEGGITLTFSFPARGLAGEDTGTQNDSDSAPLA